MFRLSDVFGKKPQPPAAAPAPVPSQSTEELRNNPNYIRVFDSFGRELFITKEEWRTNVLPANLKSSWDDPDKLYDIIVGALRDGFGAEVVIAAAEHLYRIDTIPSRSAVLYGIALLETKQLDAAQSVLEKHINTHGDDGVVLTNLAKVYAAQGDTQRSDATLWHALEVDPNFENAFNWRWSQHKERNGDAAGLQELERIAALPGSWRAQLWQARAALDRHDLEAAIQFYTVALRNAGQPAPTPLLMQLSGDLGNHHKLAEALQLTQPAFDPQFHGLMVGNNLIKAHLDLGHIDAADSILQQLYSQQRPDWKSTLGFWDTEIAKARIAARPPAPDAPIETTLLTIEGPVWLKPSSPANSIFPIAKTGPRICLLGCTASFPQGSDKIILQLADEPGRLSRALPLFFAEQAHFHTDMPVRTLVPWTQTHPGAFVLSGAPWTDAEAATYAKSTEPASAFVVTVHIAASPEKLPHTWSLQLRLVRTSDAFCVGDSAGDFNTTDSNASLETVSRQLLSLLLKEAGATSTQATSAYQIPIGHLPDYLLRLEQLLATRCASMEGPTSGTLHGEREVLDGMINLALACPGNVAVRLVLAQALVVMRTVRPAVVQEYRSRTDQLQRQHPLAEPAGSVVSKLIGEAFALGLFIGSRTAR